DARLSRELLVVRPVQTERWVPRMEPRTDRIVRGHVAWENDEMPESLRQFENKFGFGGVPIQYLFRHVNPQDVRRAQLPALAGGIHADGSARWQQAQVNAP